jgi:hypothetical protein
VAALLAAGALGPVALAQEPQAELCAVSIGRGATAPGGATGTMIVRATGRPCHIWNFTVPDQRVATTGLELVRAPAQGRLEITQPNVVAYTPNTGYTGPDEFHYGGGGPGRDGRTLPFSVRIRVRVVDPAAPLR